MEYTTNTQPFIDCIVEAIAQYEYREISRMAVYERFMGIHDMAVAMIQLNEIEEAIRTLAVKEEYGIYRDFLNYYSITV